MRTSDLEIQGKCVRFQNYRNHNGVGSVKEGVDQLSMSLVIFSKLTSAKRMKTIRFGWTEIGKRFNQICCRIYKNHSFFELDSSL